MLKRSFLCLLLSTLLLADRVTAQTSAPDKVVVSYPSKSITNFPILETAQRRGFFQKENLSVSMVYMRGGIDIKAIITGDADFGTGSTTAVTAFVAGAPLRVVMSMNAFVDQALYAQPKYRNLAQLKGQSIGSLNPGGLVDTLLRRIIVKEGFSPETRFYLAQHGRHAGTVRGVEVGNARRIDVERAAQPARRERRLYQDRRHPRLCRRSGHGVRHPCR